MFTFFKAREIAVEPSENSTLVIQVEDRVVDIQQRGKSESTDMAGRGQTIGRRPASLEVSVMKTDLVVPDEIIESSEGDSKGLFML